MSNEINLFEKDLEASEQKKTNLFKKNKITEQLTLPGILENIQAEQRAKQQERFIRQRGKQIIEALLFSHSDPLSFNKIKEIVDSFQVFKPRVVKDLIMELQQEYLSQQRAFRIEEIGEGFLLRTCEEYSPFIDILKNNKRSEKLSHASAEVLAIIAYKQPITRPQVEAIRGVDCSGIIYNLLERQLIESTGKLEAPGRPSLYGTTKDFLQHFGLRNTEELSLLS